MSRDFPAFGQLSGIPQIEGFKSGIFSAENGLLYLRHQAFRPDLTPVAMEDLKDEHLIASPGFLDGTPQHRTYWSIDTDLRYGPATGFNTPGPQGDIVAVEGDVFYEIRSYLPGRHGQLRPGRGYTLYSGARSATAWRPPRKGKPIQLGTVVPALAQLGTTVVHADSLVRPCPDRGRGDRRGRRGTDGSVLRRRRAVE